MGERSALFARLRLMIARFLARYGDGPAFGGSAGGHVRVGMPPRRGGPPRGAAMALAEPDEAE